jgi:hypothetical protein
VPSALAKAAIAYPERLGWAVFPLAPRSKQPLYGGKGVLDASTDVDLVRQRWTNRPDAGIGIATGNPSGIFVLDVDPRHGGDETLAEFERRHGPLPVTAKALTGGGGEHIVFRNVPGLRNSANQLGAGLDIRATGGYVVAAPSIHPETGRAYAWSVDHHPLDTPVADAPEWLLKLLAPLTQGEKPAAAPEEWGRLIGEGIDEGGRNHALARLAGHFLRHYIDPHVVIEVARCWNQTRCRPPLPDDELIKTINSIAVREIARRQEIYRDR